MNVFFFFLTLYSFYTLLIIFSELSTFWEINQESSEILFIPVMKTPHGDPHPCYVCAVYKHRAFLETFFITYLVLE